ncbi:MAG TPA: ABC transporter ATP-binding protein [Thermomicrobiaceae bacterium]|nr:ABC transporter ATP-binding protein [Thermomicrobiaceae bacterium]
MARAIVTAGLTKCYDGRPVVDDLTLTVRRGEIYGFLGLNGAGKTTTIRMLLGMVRPTAGTARLLDTPVHPGAHDLWARVGYLVELPQVYPRLSVREDLEVVRRLRRVADPRAVERVIERLGLTPWSDQQAGTLSLGNRQRLGLARAMLHAPDLLLLDEPANGLDPAGVVEVRELLRELAYDHGVTVFMSSHVLGEIARLATRIGVIHRGRLVEDVDTGALERRRWLAVDARDRDAARAVLLGAGYAVDPTPAGPLILTDARAVACPEAVARLLVIADLPPRHLSVEQEDLERHFLHLVGEDRWAAP